MVVPVVFPAPGLPIENPTNIIAVVSLSGDTPVSNKPNCFYELSDVGRIAFEDGPKTLASVGRRDCRGVGREVHPGPSQRDGAVGAAEPGD
jgi:hypothetical protein